MTSIESISIFQLALSRSREIIDHLATDIPDDLVDGGQELLSYLVPKAGPIGVIIKLFHGTQVLLFARKVQKFLQAIERGHVSDKMIQDYENKLGKDTAKVGNYLMTHLLTADQEEKATIMGYLFTAAINNLIDSRTMLRLCAIVNNIFLPDLDRLPDYVEVSEKDSIEKNSFINLGLIDNPVVGVWINKPNYQLNDTGKILYAILRDNGWFQ